MTRAVKVYRPLITDLSHAAAANVAQCIYKHVAGGQGGPMANPDRSEWADPKYSFSG